MTARAVAESEEDIAAGMTIGAEESWAQSATDPVNALLSLAYSVLAKDLTIVCEAVGFDPFIGLFHQPRFGRPQMQLEAGRFHHEGRAVVRYQVERHLMGGAGRH